MKTKIFIALVMAFVSLTSLAQSKKENKTTTFEVDLHCDACVKKVQSNIAYEKGVKDLNISLENKEVTVTYRADKTSPDALKKAFEKLGYVAKEKEPANKKAPEKAPTK